MQGLERGVIIVGRVCIVGNVIVFNIRDDCNLWFEELKIWIGLVHFGNEIFAAPELRVAANLAQFTTDHAGWITARALKHRRNHRRCAGLTVRANHTDAMTRVHQITEHINAFHDLHASRSGRDDFGFRFTDRGAGHEHVDGIDLTGLNVRRIVTLPNLHTSSLELACQNVQLTIATRNSSTRIQQDLRQTAHADPPNAHEVIMRAHRGLQKKAEKRLKVKEESKSSSPFFPLCSFLLTRQHLMGCFPLKKSLHPNAVNVVRANVI